MVAPALHEPAAVKAAPAAEAHRSFLGARHFPSLDGLRCLAILPVVWHHSTPRPLPGVLGRGPLGVDLFFAISGFLITTLLLREASTTGRISLSGFYARRSLRIFPLYFAVLGLYTLWAAFGLNGTPQRAHFFESLPFYATYTSNWLVDFAVPHPVLFAFSWSLATEEQFYMVWPWIMRAWRRWWIPVAFMVVALVLDQCADRGLLSQVLDSSGLLFRMIASIAAPICLGALLAHGLHHARSFGLLRVVLGWKASAPVALGVLAVLVCLPEPPLLGIHLAMAALVGACSLRTDHGLRRLLDARVLRYIGTISYGMYMLHISAIHVAKRVVPDTWGTVWVFLLGLILALGLSDLSYRLFERPFLRLRGRFRASPGGSVDPLRTKTSAVPQRDDASTPTPLVAARSQRTRG